jgi:hypothetical protein
MLEGAVVSLANELPIEIQAASLKAISSLVQDGQNPIAVPRAARTIPQDRYLLRCALGPISSTRIFPTRNV